MKFNTLYLCTNTHISIHTEDSNYNVLYILWYKPVKILSGHVCNHMESIRSYLSEIQIIVEMFISVQDRRKIQPRQMLYTGNINLQ